MANFGTFDLGSVYRDVEAIKGARTRNRMLGFQEDELEERGQAQQKKQAVDQAYDAMPDRIEQYRAQGLHQEAQDLQTEYVNAKKATYDVFDLESRTLDVDNWSEKRSNYLKAGLIGPGDMPVRYDSEWVDAIRRKAKADYKIVTRRFGTSKGTRAVDIPVSGGQPGRPGRPYDPNAGKGSAARKDYKIVTQKFGTPEGQMAVDIPVINGVRGEPGHPYNPRTGKSSKKEYKILTRKFGTPEGTRAVDFPVIDGERGAGGRPYDPYGGKRKSGGAGGERGMKPADSSEIRRNVVDLFGGFYDPQTNKISGLSDDEKQRALAIEEEAARIYLANPAMSHAQAAAQAARTAGIDIEKLTKNPNDPLGLFP